MSSSRIDFSAQYGGRDAAQIAVPHFRALKMASRGRRLEGFRFKMLAFLLRVDGEVNRYQLSGAGNVEIDGDGEYLSVDIGITHDDRDRILDVISSALLSSIEQIKASEGASSRNIDFAALQTCLLDLIARYKKELPIQLAGDSNAGG